MDFTERFKELLRKPFKGKKKKCPMCKRLTRNIEGVHYGYCERCAKIASHISAPRVELSRIIQASFDKRNHEKNY